MATGGKYEDWLYNLGRDGWDQPLAVPADMSAESVNIELREGGLGRKRSGSTVVSIPGALTGDYDGYLVMAKFVPNNNEAAAELWFVGGTAGLNLPVYRVPNATALQLTLKQAIAFFPAAATFAALNGKFFMAANTTVNRIQVYAPNESTTVMRFAGLKPEILPGVADQGVGTYPAIPRTYQVVTFRIVSGVVVSQSEPSGVASFTPSGAGLSARVTHNAVSGEGETHWQVQAAAADGIYWAISGRIAIATTTFDDTTQPQNYPAVGDPVELIGSNYPFPSVKYLISDGNRLYGLGVWETSAGDSVPPVTGRLYFTPSLNTSDMGDDERIVNTVVASGWIDLANGAGGKDRGIGGPINNSIFAFQSNSTYQFEPTGNPDTPFRRKVLSTTIGAVSHKSIVLAEDEAGQPALYFLNPFDGPRRIGIGYTIDWLGKDVKDIWDTVNLDADEEYRAWGIYDSARKLIIWALATNGASAPNLMIVYDVTNGRYVKDRELRYGWVQWNGLIASCRAGVMFNSQLTSTHPFSQLPYYGPSTGEFVYQTNLTGTQDGSTSYQAYVRSRAFRWLPIGFLKKLISAVVVAKARAATTILTRYIGNWGSQTLDQTVSVAAAGSEAYVRPRPNPVDFTDLQTLQVQIGDSAAANNSWELEMWEGKIENLPESQ